MGLIVAGFAAETTKAVEYARAKLSRKNLDLIIANDVSQIGSGFGSDTNQITILRRSEELPLELSIMSKIEAAHRILDAILAIRQ